MNLWIICLLFHIASFPVQRLSHGKSGEEKCAGASSRNGRARVWSRLVPGRVCKVVEPLVEPAPELERVRILGNPTAPLVTCPPAHLLPSSAVTCPASDIRHSGAGCASAKKIWVGTLWIFTILTNNGYFNELINWLFVNHCVYIQEESIKTWKMGKVQWNMIAHYWTMLGHLGACGGLILLKLLLMQRTAKAFQG